MNHNRTVKRSSVPVINPSPSRKHGDPICILLQDGSLFGPFKSREDAIYWAIAQELNGYSTYDLRKP
jgi:hypothetical protein